MVLSWKKTSVIIPTFDEEESISNYARDMIKEIYIKLELIILKMNIQGMIKK